MEDRKEAIRKEADRLLPEQMYFCRGSLEDLEEINEIEHICFPENEACSREHFVKRLTIAPEHFLLIKERTDTGRDRIVGFVNDIATDQKTVSDEMFTNIVEHRPEGAYLMILGLDVRPEYRHRGYAGMLLRQLIENARQEGRRGVGLTCHDFLIPYYSRFGFRDLGVSASVWGGETWYDMRIDF